MINNPSQEELKEEFTKNQQNLNAAERDNTEYVNI
jgi:hypothetical protein